MRRDPFEVVAESFLARFRAGERPSIEDYAARHPELAAQIRELLPALVLVVQDLTLDPAPSAAPAPWAATVGESRRLGDYLIIREIGRGGMGVVYEAEQVSLGRRVALKVLPAHMACDDKALERFRREAKAAARLHHTNIVPVFEVGRDGGVAYYAMQFIQGQGLDQVIAELARLRDHGRDRGAVGPVPNVAAAATGPRELTPGRVAELLLSGRLATVGAVPPPGGTPAPDGPAATQGLDPDATLAPGSTAAGTEGFVRDAAPAPPASAVLPGGAEIATTALSGRRPPFFRSVAQIGRQAAQGLAYAHARGVLHRDIKPSNLLLDHAGVVWIADFGLAKAKAEDDGLTATGDVMGTLRYMAPERFRGQGDARADTYALGLTLYELLTLRPAFDTSDRLRLIERIKTEQPARPRSLDGRIPRDLETIVLKAIEKDPKRRYQSAEMMAEDLGRLLDDEPVAGAPNDGAGAIRPLGAAPPGDRGARRRADRRAGAGHGRIANRRIAVSRAVASRRAQDPRGQRADPGAGAAALRQPHQPGPARGGHRHRRGRAAAGPMPSFNPWLGMGLRQAALSPRTAYSARTQPAGQRGRVQPRWPAGGFRGRRMVQRLEEHPRG